MNRKLKWGTAGRLRRGAVILGVVGLAAGAAVSTAGSALAANGSEPGHLVLSPASGAVGTKPTATTTDACPTNFNGSAQLAEFNTDGSFASSISQVNNAVTAAFSLNLLGNVGALLGSSNVTNGGTVEWAVACYPSANTVGTPEYVQSTFVTLDSTGANYSSSGTVVGPASTTTTLTASPNPAAVNATVTLTATEVASDSTHPAGTVQFEVGGTNIGTPVAVNASGVATTTDSFSSAGNEALSAVFVPTNTSAYSGSTGTFAEAVGSLLAGGTNPVSINVTVPATGTLSVTVATGSVTLTPQSTTPDETATGNLNQVTVSDSRNTFPGWSVSGQESTFTGSGTATIPANSLGWTPAFVGSAVGAAAIGGAVAPVGANTGSSGPGLGTAATLASATPGNGFGTNILTAALLLDIPSSTPPGAYAGNLTITYVTAGP